MNDQSVIIINNDEVFITLLLVLSGIKLRKSEQNSRTCDEKSRRTIERWRALAATFTRTGVEGISQFGGQTQAFYVLYPCGSGHGMDGRDNTRERVYSIDQSQNNVRLLVQIRILTQQNEFCQHSEHILSQAKGKFRINCVEL